MKIITKTTIVAEVIALSKLGLDHLLISILPAKLYFKDELVDRD